MKGAAKLTTPELAAHLERVTWRPRPEAGSFPTEARRYLFQEVRGGALLPTVLGGWIMRRPASPVSDWLRGLVPPRTLLCEEGGWPHPRVPEEWGLTEVWAALRAFPPSPLPDLVAGLGDLFQALPVESVFLSDRPRMPLIYGALHLRERGLSAGSSETEGAVTASPDLYLGASTFVSMDPCIGRRTP